MKSKAIAKIVLVLMIAVVSMVAQTPGGAARKPLTRSQILSLLAGDVPSSRVTMLVEDLGIDFASNDAFLDQVRKVGGEDDLVAALQSARTTVNASPVPPPPSPTPSPTGTKPSPNVSTPSPGGPGPNAKLDEAREEELAQHAGRGGAFLQDRHYAMAENEYRAAIKLDPQNAFLHIALSRALNFQKKTDESMKEAHIAIKLDPDNDMAHFCLANSLRLQEDYPGAVAEYHVALKLNPKFDMAHNNLGLALDKQKNIDGAIAEYRVAVGISPKNPVFATNLGNALETKGDLDGAIATFQELIRLRPRLPAPHYRLAQLFEKKGEPRKALNQYRMATDLAPENHLFQQAYEKALGNR
jgi:tetratricopeptide (TPR) repeat protein